MAKLIFFRCKSTFSKGITMSNNKRCATKAFTFFFSRNNKQNRNDWERSKKSHIRTLLNTLKVKVDTQLLVACSITAVSSLNVCRNVHEIVNIANIDINGLPNTTTKYAIYLFFFKKNVKMNNKYLHWCWLSLWLFWCVNNIIWCCCDCCT